MGKRFKEFNGFRRFNGFNRDGAALFVILSGEKSCMLGKRLSE
jgi:hypothetical protein